MFRKNAPDRYTVCLYLSSIYIRYMNMYVVLILLALIARGNKSHIEHRKCQSYPAHVHWMRYHISFNSFCFHKRKICRTISECVSRFVAHQKPSTKKSHWIIWLVMRCTVVAVKRKSFSFTLNFTCVCAYAENVSMNKFHLSSDLTIWIECGLARACMQTVEKSSNSSSTNSNNVCNKNAQFNCDAYQLDWTK